MELEPRQLKISPMPKTWILDLDGTLLVHDGPYLLGKDEFLTGAREFLDSIPHGDMIILLTAFCERKHGAVRRRERIPAEK